MGAFFTNVQVCVPAGRDVEEVAQAVLDRVGEELIGEGFRLAKEREASDREFVLVWSERWVSFYDQYAEDQGGGGMTWARLLSEALGLDAMSVLVHDSDVLDLALFVRGKQRDRFDSNPGFSGKRASTLAPAARAKRWAHLLAPRRKLKELEAVFSDASELAEHALGRLGPALGLALDRLATGFNYLTRDAEPLPSEHLRVRCRRTKRPPWEKRLTGKPRFRSTWHDHDPADRPVRPPDVTLVNQPIHLCAEAVNRGGASTGLRIEVALDGDPSLVKLERLEVVVTLPGRLQMARYPSVLRRRADGALIAELPQVALQPGAPKDLDFDGAPMEAFLDLSNAGKTHVNIFGTAVRAGSLRLAITFVPLTHVGGAHTEQATLEIQPVRNAPRRAATELHVDALDDLASESHSYLLALIDAPATKVKTHTLEVLDALRPVWPKGQWFAFASHAPFELGREIKAKGALSDKQVWRTLERPLRSARFAFEAHCQSTRRSGDDDESGFELSLERDLGVFSLALPTRAAPAAQVSSLVTPILDAWARDGEVVQALLARWHSGPSPENPYESVVGIFGRAAARRAWAERWVRAIGRGHLWLGPALRKRAGSLPGAVALGGSRRLVVTDVAAVEQLLAPLLPSLADYHAFERTQRDV